MSNIIDSIQLSGITYQIQGSGGGGTVDPSLDPTSTNPVENKAIYNKFDEVEQVTAAGLNALNDKITPTVELTQAQYDALATKDPNTYYIITDAQAGDLTNYYTKSEVDTALGGKQATLVSGTNIKTINNESILGSGNIDIQGGSTYTAGRGISIANDTISFNLPISAGTGARSIICGGNCVASKPNSAAFGNNASATGQQSFAINQSKASGQDSFSQGISYAVKYLSAAFGRLNYSKNDCELSCGSYNNSVSASTTFGNSGNTLFSVGNGTADNARHNAFEIRQNGDIYLTKDGQDVKLQDQLGGSSITVDTALDSGSTNPVENRVIYNKIDEVEQVTAAGLNAVNDALGGLKLVKLTQAEYNALATKDSSTLYVIVD